MNPSCATPTGTRSYFQAFAVPLSKRRDFDGLTLSALGAGTYLGPADDETDEQYLKILIEAGMGGVNCFDTAIHYRGQRSERILGKALKALEKKGFPREAFVIGTKGGVIPAEGSPQGFDEYLRTHFLDTGIIRPQEIAAGTHCISSSFLENQIEASLKNLGVSCIDQYLLYNPEIHLGEMGEEVFQKRLTEAFFLLERKISEKKIARYGLATWNGFRKKKGALQLSMVLQCAQAAGGERHHFKSIQLPFNLVMPEILEIENQRFGKEKMTLCEAAREQGIAVMASSPLMQGQVKLLCSKVFESLPKEGSRMAAALQFALSTPCICSAFIGMREPAHWAENRKALLQETWKIDEWSAACGKLGIRVKK